MVPAAAAAMPRPSSSSALAPLPAGYHRGMVKKFFDQPDRLYGFIAVHEANAGEWNFGPDAYFKWFQRNTTTEPVFPRTRCEMRAAGLQS